MADYPIDTIPQGSEEFVYTTHVTNQEHFYVHIESRSKILDDIMENLADRYMKLKNEDKPLHNKNVGGLCAAKFTDDNNWYRAKITDLVRSSGLIGVQFVDFGNTDYVSEDRVKALDPDLVLYPVQSYRCALANVSRAQGFWPPELMVQFEDRVGDKRCQAKFMGKRETDEVYLVEMYDGEGNNLNKMFGATDAARGNTKGGHNVPNVPNGNSDAEKFKETVFNIGTKIQASVVYANDPGLFWIQDSAYANEIIILSEELSRLHMTQDIQPLKSVHPGMICAAKFSEDEAWYRGIVRSVSGNTAQVYFVDYGNTESVSVDVVCNLKSDMRQMPALAVKCQLANVEKKTRDWRPQVVEKFEELAVDKEFEVTIVSREGDIYSVTLLDIVENRDMGSQLQPIIEKADKSPTPPKTGNSNAQNANVNRGIGPTLDAGERADAFLTWIDNPCDFWVQRNDSQELLEQLTAELQDFYSQPQPQAHVSPGAFVVAKFSQDQLWYRGLVLKDLEDGHVRVLFIDYGNSETLPASELRKVTPAFGQIVPLAFRCCLLGVKPMVKGDKSWTTDARDFLESLTQDGCVVEVVDETESHRLVRLRVGEKDVAQELVALRVVADAVPDSLYVPMYKNSVTVRKSQVENIIVTHIDSPNSIWCHLTRNDRDLDDLMAKLELHYSDGGGNPLKDPVIGQACIAQYSVDNAWYRGSVMNATNSGYDVHFVDYGNMELVPASAVCDPEPRFLDLPTQAVNCSLPVSGEAEQLNDALSEAVLEKELRMEVLDALNNLVIVELYDEGRKISEYLDSRLATSPHLKKSTSSLSLTPPTTIPPGSAVHAFTSVVISPNKFFLQVAGIDENLGAFMDSMALKYVSDNPPPPLTNPQVGQPCAGLYSEDNHWYRGEITAVHSNQCTVLFVDYGNEETIALENIRTLTPDVASVPVMAYKCSLYGIENSELSQTALDFFESLVMDQDLTCTFITESLVKIICDGQDIATELINKGHCKAGRSPKVGSASTDKRAETESNSGFGKSPRKRDGQRTDGGRRTELQGSRSEGGDREFGAGHRGESGGFGGRHREGGSGDFGGEKRRGERDAGFGGGRGNKESGFGGRRDRKLSSDSTPGSGFTYPDPPTEPERAILVHMDEDGTFYLQLPSMEKDILFLAKRLAGSYKNGGGPRLKDTPHKGVVCCSKFSVDGNMYRSLIEEVSGNNVIVRYVDYGNTGECSTYDLKFLFPDLLEYPVQAFPCKLRGLNWSLNQAKKFGDATLDLNLEVTFTSTTPPFEVDVRTPHGDLLGIMTGKTAAPSAKLSPKPGGFGGGKTSPKGGFGGKSPSGGFGGKSPNSSSGNAFGSSTPKKSGGRSLNFEQSPLKAAPSVPDQKIQAQVAPQGNHTAFISHIDEDGYFYVQLEKDTTFLDNISEKLTGLKGNLQHPDPSTGSACAAVFSEDSSWYRAVIHTVHPDRLEVTFVDYGNGDSVSLTNIKPLTQELLAQPPVAYKCQFPDLGPLSGEAQSKLSEYLLEHPLMVSFSGKKSPFDVLVTTADEQDLQEIICPSDKFRPCAVPKEVSPAGVSHIEDDGRFFLQLFKDYKAINEMQTALKSAYDPNKIEKIEAPEAEMTCFLKCQEDEECYRGKILKVKDGIAEVVLVDSGKTSEVEVDTLYLLERSFLKMPPFALECRLQGVDSWTESLLEKFTEMTQGKVLNATFHTATPPYRVSLARSIELDLLGLAAPAPSSPVRSSSLMEETSASSVDIATATSPSPGAVEAYIAHVDPDGSFYVQIVSREEALNDLADKLEEALAAPKNLEGSAVGNIVCAKFTEDDAWYRARVDACEGEDLFKVRFVDYGNTDVVGTDRLASLPDGTELSSIPPFASKSRLSGATEDMSREQVDKMKNLVTDKVVLVKFQKEKDGIHEVQVTSEGVQLAKALGIDVRANEEGVNKSTDSAEDKNEFTDAVENLPQAESDPKSNQTGNEGEPREVLEEVPVKPPTSMAAGQRVAVAIPYVVSPDLFYLQLEDNRPGLDELMDKMFEHFSSLPEGEAVIENLSNGDLCAALFEDESWYRVQVMDVNEDGTYEVFYIDHGNTETAESSTLRQLPEMFRSYPAWALKSKLSGVKPVEKKWTEQAVEEFKNMVEEKSLLADIIQVPGDGDCAYVHLLELGIHVHEDLIKKGHAVASNEEVAVSKGIQRIFSDSSDSYLTKPDSLSQCLESTHLEGDEETAKETMMLSGVHAEQKIGCLSNNLEELKEVNAYVTHSVSPSLFWCQLSTAVDALSEIAESIESAYQSINETDQATDNLHIGDILVAKSPNDEQLYRSRVLSTNLETEGEEPSSEQCVLVRFIDYGDEAKVLKDQVFKVRDTVSRLPAQAICCCLDNIQSAEEEWSAGACQKFSDFVQDQELSLKLVGREKDGTVLVELTISETGQSVAGMLIEAGIAVAANAELGSKPLTKNCNLKSADMSEIDSLEISQPIMESTAMVGDQTQSTEPNYSVCESDESPFRHMNLSHHTEYDASVSNDELPSSFHVQLNELKNQYSSLMAEIAEHVVSDSCLDSSGFIPKVGDACLIQHCGVWYRGEVLMEDSGTWNVKSVDCGWEANVSSNEIKDIPNKFQSLPAQAVHCYLAGLVSVEPEWCLDAISFFMDCVRDRSLCMYVLEHADDGKYGVYINDLDSTGSHSVNRAMVDLGYAEVVPGSNIEVQIEMEKTLDTDMLNDLEESFKEVSILKHNAHCESEDAALKNDSASENPLGDTYEESEICKASKRNVDKRLYELVHISDSVLLSEDSGKLPSDFTPEAEKDKDSTASSKMKEFNLASAVEQIDQMGCIDPDEGLSVVVEEVEELSSEEKDSNLEGQERHACDEDGEKKRDKPDKQDEILERAERDVISPQHKMKQAVVDNISPQTQAKAKSLYTWGVELNAAAGDGKPDVVEGKRQEEKVLPAGSSRNNSSENSSEAAPHNIDQIVETDVLPTLSHLDQSNGESEKYIEKTMADWSDSKKKEPSNGSCRKSKSETDKESKHGENYPVILIETSNNDTEAEAGQTACQLKISGLEAVSEPVSKSRAIENKCHEGIEGWNKSVVGDGGDGGGEKNEDAQDNQNKMISPQLKREEEELYEEKSDNANEQTQAGEEIVDGKNNNGDKEKNKSMTQAKKLQLAHIEDIEDEPLPYEYYEDNIIGAQLSEQKSVFDSGASEQKEVSKEAAEGSHCNHIEHQWSGSNNNETESKVIEGWGSKDSHDGTEKDQNGSDKNGGDSEDDDDPDTGGAAVNLSLITLDRTGNVDESCYTESKGKIFTLEQIDAVNQNDTDMTESGSYITDVIHENIEFFIKSVRMEVTTKDVKDESIDRVDLSEANTLEKQEVKDMQGEVLEGENNILKECRDENLASFHDEHSQEYTNSSPGSTKSNQEKDESFENALFVSCLDFDVPETSPKDESETQSEQNVLEVEDFASQKNPGECQAEQQDQACDGKSTSTGDDTADIETYTDAVDINPHSAGSSKSTSSTGVVSLDTTVDEYESCSELVTQEDENEISFDSSNCFAESSIDSQRRVCENEDESNYDTSSLIFSDSCVDFSENASSLAAGLETPSRSDVSHLERSHELTNGKPPSESSSSSSESQPSASTCEVSFSTESTSLESSFGPGGATGMSNGVNHAADDSVSDIDPFDVSAISITSHSAAGGAAYEADVSHIEETTEEAQQTLSDKEQDDSEVSELSSEDTQGEEVLENFQEPDQDEQPLVSVGPDCAIYATAEAKEGVCCSDEVTINDGTSVIYDGSEVCCDPNKGHNENKEFDKIKEEDCGSKQEHDKSKAENNTEKDHETKHEGCTVKEQDHGSKEENSAEEEKNHEDIEQIFKNKEEYNESGDAQVDFAISTEAIVDDTEKSKGNNKDVKSRRVFLEPSSVKSRESSIDRKDEEVLESGPPSFHEDAIDITEEPTLDNGAAEKSELEDQAGDRSQQTMSDDVTEETNKEESTPGKENEDEKLDSTGENATAWKNEGSEA